MKEDNVSIESLLTIQGRKEALAQIALMSIRGVHSEKMSPKGYPVPCIEYPLAAGVAAIKLLHEIEKEAESTGTQFVLNISTM
jgi:hypothetical protein